MNSAKLEDWGFQISQETTEVHHRSHLSNMKLLELGVRSATF